jgi:hypothetical protein
MLPIKFGFIGQVVSQKIFRNQPIKNKNCLWQPCLLTNRAKMSNLYRGSSIDASYQVSVHLAKGFQGRMSKCENEITIYLPSLASTSMFSLGGCCIILRGESSSSSLTTEGQ